MRERSGGIGVALAGSASARRFSGFGVGMQSATTIADLVLGAAALMLVAGRDDLPRVGDQCVSSAPLGALNA
jgi:hypothetical protein